MTKIFLHVGCGKKRKNQAGPGFQSDVWEEIRLDIDPSVSPDIVGTMTDMSAVADASVDAVFSSHNIEHLYPHEVPVAFKEFLRVLKPTGIAVITCPDLQSVAKLVAEGNLLEPAYISRLGPIAPIDIMYGLRTSMAAGNLYMAHRCGFTANVLSATLHEAGFACAVSGARSKLFDLWALASKEKIVEAELKALAQVHFPANDW